MKTYADRHEDDQKKLKRKKNIFRSDNLQRQVSEMSDGEIMRMATYSQFGGQIQRKMDVSQPGDHSEVQADTFASSFMNGDSEHGQNALSPSSTVVSRDSQGEALETTNEFDEQLQMSKGGGEPMEEDLMLELEGHIDADLSDVNVHTGEEANEMSENVSAKAFTHGRDIYFKKGNYNPQTEAGRELIAHEVGHVMQNGREVMPKTIDREIDQPGSVRIIQDRMDSQNVTGVRDDVTDKNKEIWTSDDALLQWLFEEVMDQSLVNSADLLKDVKDDAHKYLNDMKGGLDKLAEFNSKYYPEQLKKMEGDAGKLFSAANEIVDIDPEQYKLIKGDHVPDKGQFKSENFMWNASQSEEAYKYGVEIGKLINGGTSPTVKNPDNMERSARRVLYNYTMLESVLPKKIRNQSNALYEKNLHVVENATQRDFGMYKTNLFHAPTYILDIKRRLAGAATKLLYNKGPVYYSNFRVNLSNYEGLLLMFDQFTNLHTIYSGAVQSLTKLGDKEYRLERIAQRKDEAEGKSVRMQELVQVTADKIDIDYTASNILSIHYDARVNEVEKSAESLVETPFPEVKSMKGFQKIPLGKNKNVGAVVLFETGNTKVIKLSIYPFDNPTDMETTLKAAAAAELLPPEEEKGEVKKSPIADFNEPGFKIDDAKTANSARFKSAISVRIIQDIVGAPMTGVFDDDTEKYIFLWQKKNGIVTNGIIEESSMRFIFNQLKTSGNFNALIRLVIAFYDFETELMKLQESDYRVQEPDNPKPAFKSLDEILMTVYYKQDALEKTDIEAAVTISDSSQSVPVFVRFGEKAFHDYDFFVGSIAHEFIHSMQQATGSDTPESSGELHAYLTGLQKKFGSIKLPDVPDSEKDKELFSLVMNTYTATDYYTKFKEPENYFRNRSVMELHADTAEAQMKNRFGVEDFKRIAKQNNTAPQPYSQQKENDVILTNEFIQMLRKLTGFVEAVEKFSKGDISVATIEVVRKAADKFKDASWQFDSELLLGKDYESGLDIQWRHRIDTFFLDIKRGARTLAFHIPVIVEEAIRTKETTKGDDKNDSIDAEIKVLKDELKIVFGSELELTLSGLKDVYPTGVLPAEENSKILSAYSGLVEKVAVFYSSFTSTDDLVLHAPRVKENLVAATARFNDNFDSNAIANIKIKNQDQAGKVYTQEERYAILIYDCIRMLEMTTKVVDLAGLISGNNDILANTDKLMEEGRPFLESSWKYTSTAMFGDKYEILLPGDITYRIEMHFNIVKGIVRQAANNVLSYLKGKSDKIEKGVEKTKLEEKENELKTLFRL